MMKTLLFRESPFLASAVVIAIAVGYARFRPLMWTGIALLAALIAFYRHTDYVHRHPDNEIISPADGVVTKIVEGPSSTLISITLNVFNVHTQLYPCNGRVVNRLYDLNGVYKIVDGSGKSDHNEKKVHTIETRHGTVKVLQIAGFLVRRIVSSETVPEDVRAGEYLGMIKFGSRVDVEVPTAGFKMDVKHGDRIYPGQLLGRF
jgi:phosphatidylserine decarboxylase